MALGRSEVDKAMYDCDPHARRPITHSIGDGLEDEFDDPEIDPDHNFDDLDYGDEPLDVLIRRLG